MIDSTLNIERINCFYPHTVKVGYYYNKAGAVFYRPWNCYIIPTHPGVKYHLSGVSINNAVYVHALNSEYNSLACLACQDKTEFDIVIPDNDNIYYVCVSELGSKLPKMYSY